MATNRPEGRNVRHSSGQGTVGKTGDGLGTGRVGNADYSGKRRGSSGGAGGSGGFGGGGIPTRGIFGGSGLLIIIVIVFFLIRSCGGAKSGLLGALTGLVSNNGASSVLSLLGAGTDYSTTTADYSTAAGATVVSSTDKALDTTVARGSREKYTKIQGNGKDTFTILVYMCGTDLESKHGMASSDLSEMARATLSNNVNIIVYTGGTKSWRTSAISNTTNQIYKIENGGLTRLESDMGSKSMTDPNTLVEFLNYGFSKYPANRMALIFWDHGGGSVTGFGHDEKFSSSGSMTLAGIDTALKKVNKKFDFIGFDACLMATLENGLMLADYADYMIASEETEPGVGWYYTNWLTKLSQNTSMPTTELGKNIVDDFITVCAQKCRGQNTTLSLVDLAELSNTVPSALKSFASSTKGLIDGKKFDTVANARSATREYGSSQNIDQIDLIDFANKLNTAESKALAKALDGAIKYNRAGSTMNNSYGISIFFPYKRLSSVDKTVKIYDSIGMDADYTKCIKEFASVETGGQVSGGGGSNSVLGSLLNGYSQGTTSGGNVGNILSMLSGLTNSSAGSTIAEGLGTSLLGFLTDRSISDADMADYLAANYFDSSKLVWKQAGGKNVISLSDDQWDMVKDIELNVMYDDGEGYIDLGMDNIL
ncbi:MAG: peptidase C11, partial [Lachnospiraceae bacterium]|nr:peptidase C11 [Lachnospiraceae bacterium]